jgi:hypothetical protein
MKRVSLLGIAVGGITQMLAANLLLLPLTYLVLASAATGSMSEGTLRHMIEHPEILTITTGVLAGLCSVFGGYVAGRAAKRDPVLNGALSALLTIAAGLYSMTHSGEAGHSWLPFVLVPLSPALGALGGYLCPHRNTLLQ